MNSFERSTIHLIEDYLGPASTFNWGLLEWIDDFLFLTSTPHVELEALMNTVLQQHLGRFGLIEEAADNSVDKCGSIYRFETMEWGAICEEKIPTLQRFTTKVPAERTLEITTTTMHRLCPHNPMCHKRDENPCKRIPNTGVFETTRNSVECCVKHLPILEDG